MMKPNEQFSKLLGQVDKHLECVKDFIGKPSQANIGYAIIHIHNVLNCLEFLYNNYNYFGYNPKKGR